jgi:5-methylcytosine-specific restriction endonuclease McrA
VNKYGAAHRGMRRRVLTEEGYCVGYPLGVHGKVLVPTTTLDHITPLVQGGRTTRANSAALCLSCNSRKGTTERVNGRVYRDD